MEVGERGRHLLVDKEELLLAAADGRLGGATLVVRELGLLEVRRESNELGVESVHRLQYLGLAVLDLDRAARLQHATAAELVAVHLHHVLVDRRIEHDPRSAAQLTVRRNVDQDRARVLAQVVDNVRAELEDLFEHVTHAARETAPVRKDDERQLLAVVKVRDRLRRLVGRVREPHLAGVQHHDLLRVEVRWVGRLAVLHRSRLDRNHTDRNAAEARTAAHDALGPAGERLGEAVAVKEAALPRTAGCLFATGQHPARIVRRRARRKVDLTLDRIAGQQQRQRCAGRRRHVADPLEDRAHAREVVADVHVRHAVVVHDLRATELHVRRVHVASEQLVDRHRSREDHRRLVLHRALSEAHQVRSDADRATGRERDRKDLLVGTRGLAGNQARATEVLDTEAVLRSDDGRHDPPRRAVSVRHALGNHRRAELLVVVVGQVQVARAGRRVRLVVPGNLECITNLLRHADARARVGRQVDARHAELASELRRTSKQQVLARAERSDLERNVVADHNHLPPLGALGRHELETPRHHTNVVLARFTLHLHQLIVLVEHQLVLPHQRLGNAARCLTRGGARRRRRRRIGARSAAVGTRLASQVLGPNVAQCHLEQGRKVVHVRRTNVLRQVAALLQLVDARIARRDRLLVAWSRLEHRHVDRLLGLRVLGLQVRVDVKVEAGRVRDHEAQLRDVVAAANLAHELELRHAQLPQTLAVRLAETAQQRVDVVGRVRHLLENLEEDVVVLRAVEALVARVHVERLDAVGEQRLGLAHNVLLVDRAERARVANRRAHKEAPMVGALLLGKVQMHLAIGGRQVRDLVVRQANELEMEGQRRLEVAVDRVLLPRETLAERKVIRILFAADLDHRHATHAKHLELFGLLRKERAKLLESALLRLIDQQW